MTVAHTVLRAARKALELDRRAWFWGEAVAFDSAALAADVIGDADLRNAVSRILVAWSREMLSRPTQPADVYAPLSAMLRLRQGGGPGELLDAAVKVADHVIAAPSEDGAYLHELQGYPPMVFVDFIYYAGPYLGQVALSTGDPRYLDAAVQQTLGHLRRLQDPRNGLVDHVYDPGRGGTNGVAWGRGNGWALLGLVDTLAIVPADHAGREGIERGLRAMLEACLASQDESGMWHTILDDPSSPLESSVAAFFYAAFAKAQRMVLTDSDVLAATTKAWDAIMSKVREDGGFPISMTEWPDWDPLAYYRRPTGINAWGQGCLVRAGAEYLSDHAAG